MFIRPDAIAKAASWLANAEAPTCACCGEDMPEQQDRAAHWQDFDGVVEAQAYYRGPICTRCFEDMATCAHCGNKRREQDMWARTEEALLCSPQCEADLEYDNTNADNRLTFKDVM